MLADYFECRPAPGPPDDARRRTVSPRGSVSHAMPGVMPPVEGGGGGQPTSNSNHLPSPEQPLNIPPNHARLPPSHPDSAIFTDPNTQRLQQNPENGRHAYGSGHPNPQRIPLPQDQDPRQPPFYPIDRNGQPLNPPPLHPVHPLSHSVPVFGQLQDRMGQVIGLVHRGSFTLSGYADADPSVRQLPPGCPHMPPQMYPPVRPQVHPQMPPQMNPQIHPRVHPQMPPQMQTQGPVPMNWGPPPGPPPPYLGPGLAPGEPIPGRNQAGPSTVQRRASETPGTSLVSQSRSSRSHPNEGQEGDGIGLDVQTVSRRGTTGRAPTRANPARKARPTQLYESD